MSRAKQKREFMKGGPEPKVSVRDMWDRDPDGPDENVVLRLSSAIHYSESTDWVVTWAAIAKAEAFYNTHGFAAALDECMRLEKLEKKRP